MTAITRTTYAHCINLGSWSFISVLEVKVNIEVVKIWISCQEKRKLFTPVLVPSAWSCSGSAFFLRVGITLHTGARHHVMVYPVFIWHISAQVTFYHWLHQHTRNEVFVTAGLEFSRICSIFQHGNIYMTLLSTTTGMTAADYSADPCIITITWNQTGTH